MPDKLTHPLKLRARVLVTRLNPAGDILCQAIRAAGGSAYYFPTIDIVPLPETPDLTQDIASLDQYDWWIFISPQAVYTSLTAIQHAWPQFPAGVKIATMGAGTATVLKNAGLPQAVYPADEWTSEGLLDLPEFQNLAGKKIALFRGEGGREYLAEELKERGASLKHVITYRRALPKGDVSEILQRIRSHQIEVVVCTSGEGLLNLKKLLQDVWGSLKKIPVIVISERMQALAKETGFEKILLARNASQDTIMETLSQMDPKGKDMAKTPVDATDSQNNTKAPLPPERQRYFPWSGIGIFISILVLIALLVAAYFGERRFMLVDAALSSINNDLTSKMMQDQDAIAALQKNMSDAQQNLQTVAQSITELQNVTNSNRDVWSVSEAQYLTKLANDNLQVGDNLPLVIRLLQTADQEVSHVSDSKAMPIRKALAADIAALQAVPVVDTAGIYLQLSALNNEVDHLPLFNNRPVNEADSATTTSPEKTWWKQGLNESLKALKQIVIIRYNAGDKQPFIAPDQQIYLYQNIHAMLLQAMTAVTNRQPEIYRDSLQRASAWIKQYFVQEAPLTASLLKSLSELQTTVIRPELPTVAASLQAFRDYLASDTPISPSMEPSAKK